MKAKILILCISLLLAVGCVQNPDTPTPTITPTNQVITPTEQVNTTPEPLPEPVELPANLITNGMGFLAGDPEEIKTIASIGAGWCRPHPGPFSWNSIEPEKGNFDFYEPDDWVRAAQESNVVLLGTLWPYSNWDQSSCYGPECEVSSQDVFYPRFGHGLPKSRCAPCNIEDYKLFLNALVERYDGDGVDDMPGLTLPVQYWEILNEPEMHESFLTFYKGSKQEYVDLLKTSYETIKSSCPECGVVQGGAAGAEQNMLEYWANIFDLGGAEYFDVANIHYINYGDSTTLNVKEFKELLDDRNIKKPIWVTEVEVELEQDVEDYTYGALDAGAEKIFYTRFEFEKKGKPVPGRYAGVYDRVKEKIVA